MPDVFGPEGSTPAGRPHLPPTAGLDALAPSPEACGGA